MPPAPVYDDCLKLDLADPAVRKALDPRRSAAGVIRWGCADSDIAATGYDWRHVGRRLILTAEIGGVATTQTIRITTTRPHFGGVRLWFVCPESGRRARVLLLAPDRRLWASRAALGLPYASQRMGARERRLRRMIDVTERGLRRNAMRRMLKRRR